MLTVLCSVVLLIFRKNALNLNIPSLWFVYSAPSRCLIYSAVITHNSGWPWTVSGCYRKTPRGRNRLRKCARRNKSRGRLYTPERRRLALGSRQFELNQVTGCRYRLLRDSPQFVQVLNRIYHVLSYKGASQMSPIDQSFYYWRYLAFSHCK